MRDRQTLRDKMGVYFVIGTQDCGFSREKTVEIVREALAGGVGTLQLRDKGSKLTSEERCELGRQLQELCREHQTLFFVNDDVDLAVRLQADGIHVGQDDMHLAEVRAMVGEAMYIGISAGTVEEAIAAKNGGADCIGVGAMFATSSKADAGEPIERQDCGKSARLLALSCRLSESGASLSKTRSKYARPGQMALP